MKDIIEDGGSDGVVDNVEGKIRSTGYFDPVKDRLSQECQYSSPGDIDDIYLWRREIARVAQIRYMRPVTST